jgi:hypothetical protein
MLTLPGQSSVVCLRVSNFLKQAAVGEQPITRWSGEGLKATAPFRHEMMWTIGWYLVARPVGRNIEPPGHDINTPQPHFSGAWIRYLRPHRLQLDHDVAQSTGDRATAALKIPQISSLLSAHYILQ